MTRPETILYVEDDAVTRAAYKGLLQREGFTVDTARDGVEGLRFLQHTLPDLLLLDLMLPRLTGEEMLKFMATSSRLRHVPVIILSTNSIVDMNNEQLVGNTNYQLMKHACTLKQLVQVIDKVLLDTTAVRSAYTGRVVALPVSHATNGNKVAAAPKADEDPEFIAAELQKLQNKPQVVCAWTNRIKVEGKWMNIGDFLSKQLHLTVTHGISPDAMQEFMAEAKAS